MSPFRVRVVQSHRFQQPVILVITNFNYCQSKRPSMYPKLDSYGYIVKAAVTVVVVLTANSVTKHTV
jgi:hypothetical protein